MASYITRTVETTAIKAHGFVLEDSTKAPVEKDFSTVAPSALSKEEAERYLADKNPGSIIVIDDVKVNVRRMRITMEKFMEFAEAVPLSAKELENS